MRDWSLLASEYVLGTLVPEHRREAEQLLKDEPAFRQAVSEWENRLGSLAEAVEPVNPPASTWDAIQSRLGKQNTGLPKGIAAVYANEGEWKPVNENVYMKSLFVDPIQGSESYLLKFLPGGVIDEHAHGEWNDECIILDGEISVGGVPMGQGDFHVATRGAVHPRLYSETGGTLFVRSRQVTGL